MGSRKAGIQHRRGESQENAKCQGPSCAAVLEISSPNGGRRTEGTKKGYLQTQNIDKRNTSTVCHFPWQ